MGSHAEKKTVDMNNNEFQLRETIRKMKEVMVEKDKQIDNLKTVVKEKQYELKYKGRFDKHFFRGLFDSIESYDISFENDFGTSRKELYEKLRYKSKHFVYEEIKSLIEDCDCEDL